MSTIILEQQVASTQPTFALKNDILTNENLVPQKTIDYNSIAEEYVERNDTAIDLIMQTSLRTEPVTTPEPRNKLFSPFIFRILCEEKQIRS